MTMTVAQEAAVGGGAATEQLPSGQEGEAARTASSWIAELLPPDMLGFLPGDFLYIDGTEIAIRLVAAMVAGFLLGLDRELRRRPAGVRTYMLVSVGAAVYTIVTMEVVMEMRSAGSSADPTRITQGLIGGIGFLGAGAIIQSRGHIGGLSTAASIWVAGGVGMACGMGYYSHAFLVAIITSLILMLSFFIEGRGEGYDPTAPEPDARGPDPHRIADQPSSKEKRMRRREDEEEGLDPRASETEEDDEDSRRSLSRRTAADSGLSG